MAVFCSMALTSREVWTKEPMHMKCYVLRERQLRGMFEMTSSLLKSMHFPTHSSQRWGCSRSPFTPRTGAVWKRLHTLCPLGRLYLTVSPPGVWTQAGPPSVIVTHCSPLYWDRPHFTTAALGHLVLQRLPPVSKEGSFTKLGSMICPFVGCISCSASCDVTD